MTTKPERSGKPQIFYFSILFVLRGVLMLVDGLLPKQLTNKWVTKQLQSSKNRSFFLGLAITLLGVFLVVGVLLWFIIAPFWKPASLRFS